MFMESSACHEVSKGWLRSLKALMSNGRKWEVMKHNRVHDSWTKKQHVRESLRKSGRHSGTPVLHKALERSLYSGWLCAHSVACVSWPCVRHGHPLSRVSWGHKAPRPLHNWTMASSSCVSYGTALFLCVRVPVCVCTVTGQALSTLLSYTRTAPSILQPPLWTTLPGRGEGKGRQAKSRPADVLVHQGARAVSTSSAEAYRTLLDRLHVSHTCCSSLSLSVRSMKVKSSLCAASWARRRFSSSRSAIIYQTYSPMKQLYDATRRWISGCGIQCLNFTSLSN